MSLSAVSLNQYVFDKVGSFFRVLPPEGEKLECKHLFPAVLENRGVDVISDLVSRCKGVLTRKFSTLRGITLFHLSAIAGRDDLLEKFCEKKVVIYQDEKGFTPFHFRAIFTEAKDLESDPWVIKFNNTCKLHIKSAPVNSKNKFGQTPTELFKSIIEHNSFKSSFDSYSSNADQSSLHPFQNALIEDSCLGRFPFVSKSFISKQNAFDLWFKILPSGNKTPNNVLEALEEFENSPPKLKIIDSKNYFLGCEVVAHEKILANKIIATYDGEIQINPQNRSNYYFNLAGVIGGLGGEIGIDSLDFRSIASMINDGPPNLGFAFSYNENGLPINLHLYTLREIEPGEGLYFDYQLLDDIKYKSSYGITDQAYNKLKETLKEYPLSGYFKNLIQGFQEKKDAKLNTMDPTFFGIKTQLDKVADLQQYVLNTPLVLYMLVSDGIVSEKDLRALLSKEYRKFLVGIDNLAYIVMSSFLLATLRDYCKNDNRYDFFTDIMEVIQDNFSIFIDSITDLKALARAANLFRITDLLFYVLEGYEKASSEEDFESLSKQFLKDYKDKTLYEDFTLEEKKKELNKFQADLKEKMLNLMVKKFDFKDRNINHFFNWLFW